MHSLSLTEWHVCPGNVYIYGTFNCILNVSVYDGVISTCVTCVGENNSISSSATYLPDVLAILRIGGIMWLP